jgi:anti-sigma factor ChrR (cupin superfamily)
MELRETWMALAVLAPPVAPPASLRERLLTGIKKAATEPPVERITLSPGLFLQFSERMAWQETGIPGIKVKSLHVDPERRYATSLVMMAAGAIYPPHRHTDVEELFMLTGDVVVAGHPIHSGDYCRAESGTWHDAIRTENGCTFLAMASLDNERRMEIT